ncbi:MAG: Ig domain-containing protein, partial [Planctomycetota bacterium]
VTLPEDATLVEGSAERRRRVYDVTSARKTGLRIQHTSADGPDHVRNVRVWMPDPTDPTARSLEPEADEREPVFHPDYIEHINADPQLFGVIRFMDWSKMNNSPQETWDERRPPGHAFVSDAAILDKRAPGAKPNAKPGRVGVAWEHVVVFANATDKHPWISIPHAADDAYVRNVARLIRYGSDETGTPYTRPQDDPFHAPLAAHLRVWVEHSNEIWSSGANFPQGDWAQAEGEKLGLTKPQFNAKRATEMWQIFNDVFAENTDDTNRVVRVAAAWTGQIDRYTRPYLEALRNHDADTDADLAPHVLAVTTYFGQPLVDHVFNNKLFLQVEDYDDPNDPVINQALDYLLNDLVLAGQATGGERTNALGGIGSANMALAEEFGLPLVSYEGNTSMYTEGRSWMMRDANDLDAAHVRSDWAARNDPDRQRVFSLSNFVRDNYPDDDDTKWNNDRLAKLIQAVNQHPRFADVYRAHLANAKSVGLHMHGVFVDVAAGSKHGHWGHKTSQYQPVGYEPGQAIKWQTLIDWQREQADINELGVGGTVVNARPDLPTSATLTTAAPGTDIQLTIDAAPGDGPTNITLVAGVLPNGLTFNAGTLTGTIANDTTPGIYRMLIRALDEDGDVDYAIYAIEVR